MYNGFPWFFVLFLIFSILLCLFMMFCGHFLGGRSYSDSKNVPFESGIDSLGHTKIRFSIKFYLIAIFFVIFDMEGAYIYIWAISAKELGWIGFFKIFTFIFILLISLGYLVRNGIFNWVKNVDKINN